VCEPMVDCPDAHELTQAESGRPHSTKTAATTCESSGLAIYLLN